jgi:hypothetical protein
MKSNNPKKSGLSAFDINKELILQEKSQNQQTFTFTKEQPTEQPPTSLFQTSSTSDSKKLEDDDPFADEEVVKKPKRRDASSNLLAFLENNYLA